MYKGKKLFLISVIVGAMLCGVATVDVKAQTGWNKNTIGWWWEDADGSYPANAWKTIEDITYYFNDSGYMMTGWNYIDGNWYYFDESGAMATAWRYLGDAWYYFGDNGAMQIGWQEINHVRYYMYGDGKMAENTSIAGEYVDGSGACIRTDDIRSDITWIYESGGWWLQYEDGSYPTNKWELIDKVWYYFDKNGWMQTGWVWIGGSWYYFDGSGAMQTGWLNDNGVWYYLGESGAMQTGWVYVNGIQYYFRDGGAMAGIYHEVPNICQRPELPMGCEITAVTMMLQHGGSRITKLEAAEEMPRSSNPNKGFVGSPYSPVGRENYTLPGGVASVVQNHMGTYEIMSRAGIAAVQAKLMEGHPVVLWVSGMNGFDLHAITVTGYNDTYIYYNNPWTGAKERDTINSIVNKWSHCGYYAISY